MPHSIIKNDSTTNDNTTNDNTTNDNNQNENDINMYKNERAINNNQPLRIAINGFGRIGRNVLRALIERFDVLGRAIHVVAINDIADAETLLHLLQFDSTHGRLSALGVTATVTYHNSLPQNMALPRDNAQPHQSAQICLSKNNRTYCISLLNEPMPKSLPWQSLRIDVVLECTGLFRSYADASLHLQAGANQVIIGAAPFDKVDGCIVMGVNDTQLTRHLPVVSSVSCTTQALVPLLNTLDQAFGIESAMMTEIHAVTTDQNVLDQPHRDLRRARASGHNVIPTTSSSIAATERTLPHMRGRINGYSIRVPTIDVAAIDVTFTFKNMPMLADIKHSLVQACVQDSPLYGIMGFTELDLVSSDFIHQPESLIIDGNLLMQSGNQFKVFAWYDNEWGYANRLLDMCLHLSKSPR